MASLAIGPSPTHRENHKGGLLRAFETKGAERGLARENEPDCCLPAWSLNNDRPPGFIMGATW